MNERTDKRAFYLYTLCWLLPKVALFNAYLASLKWGIWSDSLVIETYRSVMHEKGVNQETILLDILFWSAIWIWWGYSIYMK